MQSGMKHFEAPIIAWAQARDDIRAVLIVGSRARRTFPADEYSDMDLIVYTTDFAPYVADRAWLEQFGTPWVVILDWLGPDHNWPEFLTVYDGALKLDFAFTPVQSLRDSVESGEPPDKRGYRVLVDKDGILTQFAPLPDAAPPGRPPTAQEFTDMVNAFWYGAVHAAKQIKRRNLWGAKVRDWTMKQQLLTLIEWHTRVVHGWAYDTWYEGKWITRWADADTLNALNDCFGHFDPADSWRALRATMDLFRRLATDTAQRSGYTYPAVLDEKVTEYIRALWEGEA